MTVGTIAECHEWVNKTSPYSWTKMIAGEDLPVGTVATFTIDEARKLDLSQDNFKKTCSSFKQVKARDSRLVVRGYEDPGSWLEYLTLAEDVQSEVARIDIKMTSPEEAILIMTITKPLRKGQFLSVWFSSELAAKLGCPFLNFSHIKDGRYCCPNCCTSFQAPNPLKLHMATSCDSIKGYRLWSHLEKKCLSVPWSIPRLLGSPSKFLENKGHQVGGGQDHLFPNNCTRSEVLKSAFKPVTSSALPRLNNLPLSLSMTYQPISSSPLIQNPQLGKTSFDLFKWTPSIKPFSSSIIPSYSSSSQPLQSSAAPSTSGMSSSYAAQVESLVSNLGRSKGNHLCIYCGKVYSRKYGLKIHIRTHTGYKPLKCRVCLRPFGDPSNLNKHVRLHAQGHTPYRCDLCGKVLVRKRDLDRHLRSRHSKEPEFKTPSEDNTTSITSPIRQEIILSDAENIDVT